MRKKLALFLALAMIAAMFAGCATQTAETPAETTPAQEAEATPEPSASAEATTGEGETFIFTDSCGREVELPKNITRVAPSGSVAQMILYTVAPDLMVGWSSNPGGQTAAYIPEKYLSLPEFGQFYGRDRKSVV